MPGGVGTWNLTGDDALYIGVTWERTRVINDANTASAYDFQAAGFTTLEAKIRTTDGTLVATGTASFTTDGSDGSIDLEFADSETTTAEAADGLIFGLVAIKSNGKRYLVQQGRCDLFDQPVYT